MDLIADGLMIAGAFGAAAYCHVLARRLKRFQTLEGGLGGAIAVLSAQVDEMTRALERARGAAEVQSGTLDDLVRRGEGAAARLEIMLAALHDLPAAEAEPTAPTTADRRLRVVRARPARPPAEAAE
jgi:hypothetical protein